MHVRVKNWKGEFIEVPLSTYFRPTTGGHDSGGSVEQARDLAEKNAEAIGFMMAKMIEQKLVSFDEAQKVLHIYDGHVIDD